MCEWMDGWVDGSKSCFKDCLQQSKNCFDVGQILCTMLRSEQNSVVHVSLSEKLFEILF